MMKMILKMQDLPFQALTGVYAESLQDAASRQVSQGSGYAFAMYYVTFLPAGQIVAISLSAFSKVRFFMYSARASSVSLITCTHSLPI